MPEPLPQRLVENVDSGCAKFARERMRERGADLGPFSKSTQAFEVHTRSSEYAVVLRDLAVVSVYNEGPYLQLYSRLHLLGHNKIQVLEGYMAIGLAFMGLRAPLNHPSRGVVVAAACMRVA